MAKGSWLYVETMGTRPSAAERGTPMQIVQLHDPPPEECGHEPPRENEPPAALVEPRSEKRLIGALREAARSRDAHEILTRAAMCSYRGAHDPTAQLLARALGDLAATGARASHQLRRSPLRPDDLATLAAARLEGVRSDDPELRVHAARTLDRARLVARFLSLDPAGRVLLARERPELMAWIAVSGEDDLPARPVNVPFTTNPQRTAHVEVGDHALRVRYSAAGTLDGSAPVVLLLHGHTSRLEEYDALTSALLALRRPDGRAKYGVLVPDLPSCGYTTRVDHEAVAPSHARGAPILEFLEQFAEAFVAAVTADLALPKRLACVAGGSLGGNLVLRLAEKRPDWIDRFAAWSPASVWSSLTGDLIKGLGLSHTRDQMFDSESERSRRSYFRDVFASRICFTGRTQPEMWYRDGLRCRPRHINLVMRDRREVYGVEYRRWHWRVAHEQLVFSHVQAMRGSASPWRLIRGPLFLSAGAHDNFTWTHIHDRTRDLAKRLAGIGATGECLLLGDTGHSIGDERPRLLASALDGFIERH